MPPHRNPYQPPAAVTELAAPPTPAIAWTPAGRLRRIATQLVDVVWISAFLWLAAIGLVKISTRETLLAIRAGDALIVGYGVVLAYYMLFEGLWGRTPGKMLMGTRVVDRRGHAPTFGRIIARSFARLAPMEALTFLGKVGFHDRVSGTKVVRTR